MYHQQKNNLNLILVSRPIDFFYAIELCHKFREKNFLIFIFSNSDPLERNAIEFLVSEFAALLPNAAIRSFPLYFKRGIFNLILFKFFLKVKFRKQRFGMISTSGGVKGRLIFKHLKFEHLIITDEGTFSRRSFPLIAESNRVFRKLLKGKQEQIQKLLRIHDLKNNDNYSIWTMYEDLVHCSPKIQHNNFQNFKKLINRWEIEVDEKEIIILGTSPHPIGLEEEEYKRIIEKVYRENKNHKVRLKPHKMFNETYNFETLETDLPIECFFLKRKKLPKKLMSFGSTSNQIIKFLFPEIIVLNLK